MNNPTYPNIKVIPETNNPPPPVPVCVIITIGNLISLGKKDGGITDCAIKLICRPILSQVVISPDFISPFAAAAPYNSSAW